MKKELDIFSPPPITLHSNFSMPLSIILSRKQFYYWYLERFVQITSNINKDGNVSHLMYHDRGPVHDEVLEKINFDLQEFIQINNVKEYIISKVNSGIYVKLKLDNYYLSFMERYLTTHYMPSYLVYGYDEKNIFVIGFDQNRNFDKLRISFEELFDSYVSIVPDCDITLYKLLDFEYEFDIQIFKNNLKDYVYSQNSIDNIYLKSTKIKSYGIDAYKDYLVTLDLFMEDKAKIQYHDFHFFWEHKKLLYERIDYISRLVSGINEIEQIQREYEKLVKSSNSIRLKYMKSVLLDPNNTLYSPILDKDLVKNIRREMQKIIFQEELLLKRLLDLLEYVSKKQK